MGKTIVRRANKRDALPVEQPRRHVLPPEIVHIIVGMLGTDKETLSACALISRDFTFAALCCLGRHITINTVRRLRECVSLLTEGSAFQHVRSLDLGITTKGMIHQRYWDDFLIILDVFARRRTLTRLWLSEVSFHFSKREKEERARDIIISLTTTVNELGLYSCHFSSYDEMISLIRSFPLCTSLYVRGCVARRTTQGSNMFADLPQHTLHISDLELSSSGHRFLADVSTLVEDAALDVSSLTGFSSGMGTANLTRRTLMVAAKSPIERLQLICEEAEGFHVLADPMVGSWPLRSLIIGPIVQKDKWWCERALKFDPKFPYLENVTFLGCRPRSVQRSPRFWRTMDQILSRQDIFPRLEQVDICLSVGSRRLWGDWLTQRYFFALRGAGKLYFWGEKAPV